MSNESKPHYAPGGIRTCDFTGHDLAQLNDSLFAPIQTWIDSLPEAA